MNVTSHVPSIVVPRESLWAPLRDLAVLGLFIVTVTQNLFIALTSRALDFTALYDSAIRYHQGLDPFAVANTNPPVTLLPILALTWLPERTLFALWDVGLILALLWSLRLIARASAVPFRVLLFAAIGLQGVGTCLRLGQVTLWLLPLMTLAWLADREGRSSAAGWWIGVLCSLKVFFGLFVLYFLWRKDWRALRGTVLGGLASLSLGLVLGPAVTLSWLHRVFAMRYMAPHVMNAAWLGPVSRLFTVERPNQEPLYTALLAAPRLSTLLWIVGVLVIAGMSFLAVQRATRDRQWAILGTAMLLISPLGWTYYLPLLLPPLAVLVPSSRSQRIFWLAAVLLWIPDNWLASGTYGVLATLTIGSVYTWGLLILWIATLKH